MTVMPKPAKPISPCLWFDRDGEEAAKFYVSIFPNSSIDTLSHYPRNGHEMHRDREGEVLFVVFRLDGQTFMALNGGTHFKLSEATSLMVYCDTQDEIDYYWDRLGAGGPADAQACGWLKDKFGLSWQVLPSALPGMMSDPERAARVMAAFMPMTKLDLATIERAYAGG